ncbi:RND family transporter [Thermodesulfobacteriota bacterium]
MSQFIHRFHKAIIIMALILTAISIMAALRLKLNLSLFSLLPSDRPEVQRFFEITEEVGFQSLLISVITVDETLDVSTITELMNTLAGQYAENPMISKVDYQRDPDQLLNMFDTLLAYIPLLLTAENMEKLSENLTSENIEQKVRENRQLLMTPLGQAGKRMLTLDPLGLGDLFFSTLQIPFHQQGGLHETGLYRTKNNRTYFMFLTPIEPPQDIAFSKKLMREVVAMEKQVLEDVSKHLDFSETAIRVRHTGGYPIAVKDEAITRLDIKVTLITSFVCVMLLFFISFRTPGVLLLVSVPLVMSLFWTIGFAGILFQHLNILTCLFACVLIGLGIDFAIHVVNRFFDPEMAGLDELSRLEATFKEAGMGIFIGGLTTAMAFYAVGLSDFKGFRELGILTGTGILFCLLAMLVFLPACLVWTSSTRRFHKKTALAGFFLTPLLTSIKRHPERTLILTTLCTGVLVIAGFQVRFDDNLKNFRPSDSSVLQLQDQVTTWLGGSTGTVLLTITGSSEEDVMNREASMVQSLQPMLEQGYISKITSTSRFLLSPVMQRRNIAWMQSHPKAFDLDRIRKNFESSLKKYGFRTSGLYDRYVEQLGEGFSSRSVLLPSHLRTSSLSPILNRLIFQKNNQFTAIIYIHPSVDLWSYEDTIRFKDRIIQNLSQADVEPASFHLTGANILTGELKRLILQNLKTSLVLASLCIVVILWVYYRNISHLFFSVLPLFIGMSMLIGFMTLFQVDFNFLNIMVLPMIIGIGIDDGVHFTNTFRHPDFHSPLRGWFQTGRAVVLTSLTTIAGFGSIILSHYPGLKSMGIVAVIGIAGCLLGSIILMPAIFEIRNRRIKKHQKEG